MTIPLIAAWLLAAAPAASPSPSPTPKGPDPVGLIEETMGNLDRQTKPLRDALSASVDDISEEDERALGQATAVDIIQSEGGLEVEDAALLTYVNRVGNLVAQQGERKILRSDGKPRPRSRDFVFGVLQDDESVNAYSTPGGYVFVTTGLLRQLGSESELAWVLGHEISHVDYEHGLSDLKTYIREKKVMEAVGNVTGDSHVKDRWKDSKFFHAMAETSARISLQLYGKQEERDADALGLTYATEAGYDANGAKRVLETMGAMTVTHSGPATHDPPAVRLTVLEPLIAAAAAKHPHDGKVGSSRFTRDCVDRLDAIAAARAKAPKPGVETTRK